MVQAGSVVLPVPENPGGGWSLGWGMHDANLDQERWTTCEEGKVNGTWKGQKTRYEHRQ